MSNRYYIHRPRNFRNEYTVYVVPADQIDRLTTLIPTAKRITRVEAIEEGIRQPRSARRNSQQWFGGLCYGVASMAAEDYRRGDAATDAELLDDAKASTLEYLDELSIR